MLQRGWSGRSIWHAWWSKQARSQSCQKVAPGRAGPGLQPTDFLKRQLQFGKFKGIGHNKRYWKYNIKKLTHDERK
ncbi:hypothetical protein L1987_32792 [Smallanthus sonchifolius]|uniref:Uncharacterized protein n=1 Tax=Smallanthus sonchifolius TaxID=185202 RepID=A0ACB9HP11_9ASTR|nr:hypothetical protein L1987_32792 [Smallanthus sonchifolius]